MVCATESSISDAEILYIKDYILDKYLPANVSTSIYSFTFVNDFVNVKQSTEHAQVHCPLLVWPFSRIGTFPAIVPIKAAQILVESDDETNVKSIIELTIDMQFASDYYQPGDTIAILPSNDITDVEELLRRMRISDKCDNLLNLRISSTCIKKNAKVPPYIPEQCTPYQLLRDCLNIHAIPKKQFLSGLANCCTNTDECAFLRCLSSKEGSANYSKLILDRGLTLLELLALCPSCKPTLELLVEHLPRLLPRPYSISNNPIGNEIKIIFSTLSQKPGVTTNMLSTLASQILGTVNPEKIPKIIMYGRQTNQFRFTAQEASEYNHILIGVGTSISPFLGFLEKKTQLFAESSIKSLGNTWLIAGAATAESVPHRARILDYKKSNVLQRYFECLSRISGATYHYVQEQLLDLGSEFVEFLMQENTILYVCADGGSISKSIEKSIAECLAQVQQITFNDALQLIKALKGNGRYREDVWL